jgi:hypothetical protein
MSCERCAGIDSIVSALTWTHLENHNFDFDAAIAYARLRSQAATPFGKRKRTPLNVWPRVLQELESMHPTPEACCNDGTCGACTRRKTRRRMCVGTLLN